MVPKPVNMRILIKNQIQYLMKDETPNLDALIQRVEPNNKQHSNTLQIEGMSHA